MAGCLGGLVPKGPRREPPAPKRSRRTGSAAGAGVLRNAPGTGRMGVVAAMLCNVRGLALWEGGRLDDRGSPCPCLSLMQAWTSEKRKNSSRSSSMSGRNQKTVASCSRGGVDERTEALDYGGIQGLEIRSRQKDCKTVSGVRQSSRPLGCRSLFGLKGCRWNNEVARQPQPRISDAIGTCKLQVAVQLQLLAVPNSLQG